MSDRHAGMMLDASGDLWRVQIINFSLHQFCGAPKSLQPYRKNFKYPAEVCLCKCKWIQVYYIYASTKWHSRDMNLPCTCRSRNRHANDSATASHIAHLACWQACNCIRQTQFKVQDLNSCFGVPREKCAAMKRTFCKLYNTAWKKTKLHVFPI